MIWNVYNSKKKQNQQNDSRADHTCENELDRLISTNHNPYIPTEPGIDLSNIDLIKLLAQGIILIYHNYP